MNRARLLTVIATALLGLAFAGCKPKAGGSCKLELKEYCTSDKAALACHDGKWEEMACKGPSGCQKAGNDGACDQAVAEDKEVCNIPNDYVCTADKKAMLKCQSNRWTNVMACLGDKGCALSPEQKKVSCDNSLANVGDACSENDDYACSATDKKSALLCKDGKFILSSQCKGKNGCRVLPGDKGSMKVECDDTVANVGDPCDKENHYTCATDEHSIVHCVNKKYVQDEKCKSKEKCTIKGDLVGCY